MITAEMKNYKIDFAESDSEDDGIFKRLDDAVN